MAQYVDLATIQWSLETLKLFNATGVSQKLTHVIPFLALKEAGAVPATPVQFEEQDDKRFWTDYLTVDPNSDDPFFDPVGGVRRPKGYYHSNAATFRKKTFARSWEAANFSENSSGETFWTLTHDYIKVLQSKMLTKAGVMTAIPAAPLAVWLLRLEPLNDTNPAEDLRSKFVARFHLTDQEQSDLFEWSGFYRLTFSEVPLRDQQVLNVLPAIRSREPQSPTEVHTESPLADSGIPEDDPIYLRVLELINDGFGGVIFTGPPGTSKSYYAENVALRLADGDPSRFLFLTFHSSYQYEDFVEGFVPTPPSGFESVPKHLLQMCETAKATDRYCVIVIDELSRTDPSRVFGEALTYLESSKRDMEFSLPSGRRATIPKNLIVIATMNPLDRGAELLDAALERRFAKIDMPASVSKLIEILDGNSVQGELKNDIVALFKSLTTSIRKDAQIGHAYFRTVQTGAQLRRLWENQIKFSVARSLYANPTELESVTKFWERVVERHDPQKADENGP